MITLSEKQILEIEKHGEREYPFECCGLLIGSFDTPGKKTVAEIFPIENAREKEARHNRSLITPKDLATTIDHDFGSFDDFKTKFNDAGVKQFGSGWVFVIADGDKLTIQSMPNQDTPFHKGTEPLFGNDVWEHAYYLKYNNRRPDYLKAWWDVVDWEAIAGRYERLRAV